jgi:hypothetical protein
LELSSFIRLQSSPELAAEILHKGALGVKRFVLALLLGEADLGLQHFFTHVYKIPANKGQQLNS